MKARAILKACDVLMPVWKWDGIVLVGGTSAEFAAWANRAVGASVTTQDGAWGHGYVELGKPWLLWAHKGNDWPTLAHEALHVVSGIFEVRGLKHSPDSEEAYTLHDGAHFTNSGQRKEMAHCSMMADTRKET